jgi:hypothetical protein
MISGLMSRSCQAEPTEKSDGPVSARFVCYKNCEDIFLFGKSHGEYMYVGWIQIMDRA